MIGKARHTATLYTSILLACLLASSCNTSVVDPNLKADATITVLDASTWLPVDEATVSFNSGPKKRTGANGQAKFSDIRAGSYLLRIEKDGCEPTITPLEIETDGTEKVVAINVSQIVLLHRRGVAVSGRILLKPQEEPDTSLTHSAPGILVELHMTSAIVDDDDPPLTFATSMRKTTTTSTGAFRFDSLPERSEYEIRIPSFTSGNKTYGPSTASVADSQLDSGQHHVAPNIILTPANEPFEAFLRTNILAEWASMMVEFTGSVDTSRLLPASIQLKRGANVLASTVTWSQNFTLLQVRQHGGASWLEGVPYTLTLSSIRDQQNRVMTPNPQVFTASLPATFSIAPIQNLRLRDSVRIRDTLRDTNIVDYATSRFRLEWDTIPRAEGYNIYYRGGVDSAWVLSPESPVSTNSAVLTGFAPPSPARAWTRYFMVLPHSSTRNVPYSYAAEISVRDGVKPSLNLSTDSSYIRDTSLIAPVNFNRTDSLTNLFISLKVNLRLLGNPQSNDPLDTNYQPTWRVGEGKVQDGAGDSTYVPTLLRFRWTSRQTGLLDVLLQAGRDARRDTLFLDFSGVRDLAGNVFDTLPGKPIINLQLQ